MSDCAQHNERRSITRRATRDVSLDQRTVISVARAAMPRKNKPPSLMIRLFSIRSKLLLVEASSALMENSSSFIEASCFLAETSRAFIEASHLLIAASCVLKLFLFSASCFFRRVSRASRLLLIAVSLELRHADPGHALDEMVGIEGDSFNER